MLGNIDTRERTFLNISVIIYIYIYIVLAAVLYICIVCTLGSTDQKSIIKCMQSVLTTTLLRHCLYLFMLYIAL